VEGVMLAAFFQNPQAQTVPRGSPELTRSRRSDGVLDVPVAEPVLNVDRVGSARDHVHGDRVLEYVEVPAVLGDLRELAVAPHEEVQGVPPDRAAVPGEEDLRERVLPRPQVRPDGLRFLGLQSVLAAEGSFETVEPHPVRARVEVAPLQEPDLGGAETVPVGEEEEGVVPPRVLLRDLEEPGQLLLREVLDRLRVHTPLG